MIDSSTERGFAPASLEGFRLSPQQEHLWRLQEGSAGPPFRLVVEVIVEGELDRAALCAALRDVVARHEILRTQFRRLPGMEAPLQVIAPEGEPRFAEHDLTGLDARTRGERRAALLESLAGAPADPENGIVLDAVLVRLGPAESTLLLGLPALCADAVSLGHLAAAIGRAYEARTAGSDPGDPPVQYADISEIFHHLLESEETAAGRAAWRDFSPAFLAVPRLPFEEPAEAQAAFAPRLLPVAPLLDLADRIGGLAEQSGVTSTAVLLTAWQALLQRLGEPEVQVAMAFGGRTYEEVREAIGQLGRHVPVRLTLDPAWSFAEALGRVDGALRESADLQDFFSWEGGNGAADTVAFPPVACEILDVPAPFAVAPGLTFSPGAPTGWSERFRLLLRGLRRGGEMSLEIGYDAGAFGAAAVADLPERLQTLLDAALAAPETPLVELPIAGPAERRRLLIDANATALDLGPELCLHRLVSARAALSPEGEAVVAGEESLTWAALEERSDRLAHHLVRLGVRRGDRVAICLERGLDLVVGLLGILKAGAAYLPLDPGYPAERLSYMLDSSAARAMVANTGQLPFLPPFSGPVVRMEETPYATEPAGPPAVPVTPDDLAYVIYTSGSTGQPKGVTIPHRAIANRLLWMQREFPLESDDKVLQKTPFGFDASIWEIFCPLFAGARLVLAQPGGHRDPRYLVDAVLEHGITVLQLVPSLLRAFLDDGRTAECGSLRRLFCGGEALPVDQLERFTSLSSAALCNLYGPTEAAIDATFWPARRGLRQAVAPIGRPLANVQVYLADERLEPVPAGLAGELWIGGANLAWGYLGRPDLTAERFLPDSWSGMPGARIYRTGDVARHRADGDLDFLGRADHQVKIRGVRIEPGEIEAVLAAHPGLTDAVVVAREDQRGDARLVAYAVPADGLVPDAAAELRAWLVERLPEAMVPSAVVLLSALPRLPNGKVDRQGLPAAEPSPPDEKLQQAAPRTITEELLVGLWSQVLGREDLDVEDNFFDVGGHSLLATQLVSRIREIFAVDLRVRHLFEAPTVAGLAAEIAAAGGARQVPPPIAPIEREAGEPLPLSFAQQRLWILVQLDGGSPVYNLPAGLRIHGPLQIDGLERALSEIVRRHEALRTTFVLVDGTPAQIVGPPFPVSIARADLSGLPVDLRLPEARRRARDEAARPFDLDRGALLRATLLRLDEDDHALLFTMHHIVGDGWSTGVLIRELGTLYDAAITGRPSPLPELSLQYADFAIWQRRWLDGPVLEGKLAFWKSRLGGRLAPLDLPADHPRPPIQSFRGARLAFRLTEELTRGIRTLTRREGASLFMTLLAAYATLLHRYSGQEEIPLGTAVANRNRREVEDLIGVFINTLVLPVDLTGEPGFRELVARVREVSLEAYAHEDLPFERLVHELQPERDLARSPLFQAMLILQNAPAGAPTLSSLQVELLPVESRVAKLDLTMELTETSRGLAGSFEYSTDLFERATVQRLAGHFEILLAAAVADPSARLLDLPLLTAGERQQILRDWNATSSAYAAGQPIHALFAEQAAAHPERIAVICGSDRLTYGELDRRAGRLAAYLGRRGIVPGSLVALSAERSVEMVVGLLGILKAGSAYLPLDPAYPEARLAFMLEDSGARLLLTQDRLRERCARGGVPVVALDADWPAIERSGRAPTAEIDPDTLAYVIYTSGSTGRPKGVMVSHRNVVNFFTGMDRRIGTGPGRWLAVTSISFDISVLELLWTLTRGFQVILQGEGQEILAAPAPAAVRPVELSLFYFANEEGNGRSDPYRLLLEGARFADRHGFAAVWTPERHFHAFGGLYPSPVVTSAAIAAVTERVAIRAGSVVLPLHHPIRVAEEWSMIDNLSRGRVGISFASGWHADDFVLAPESFARRKELMLEGIETVRRLWRGEAVRARGGAGREVDVRILPRPVQAELPVWVTAASNVETFRLAGEIGAGVLTHLLGQEVDDLERKIAVYRSAWREAGHGPGDGHVTLMLHAFVGETEESVRATVKRPFCNYLRTSLDLVRNLSRSLGREIDPAALSAADLDDVLERSFERYYKTSALLGTEESCLGMLDTLGRTGVDEIACLIDFGIDDDEVLAALPRLDAVRRRANAVPPTEEAAELSLVEQIGRHGVTHLQCTPTMARVLAGDAAARRALASLDRLLLGGEALPVSLVEQLGDAWPVEIHNMYGPTETTIWSSTWAVPAGTNRIALGRPIANTEIYVVDRQLRAVPAGIAGELLIGGLGVTRGYLHRAGLTAERFVPDPFGPRPGGRLYRTGDLARLRPGGEIEFLGRLDQQVKLHGYRIELEEIERALERHPGIERAVVTARQDGENQRLVAYFVRAGVTRAASWTGHYHRLPNGLRVACFNAFQASQAYREIFEGDVYLRHGVTLEDGDCVFDVGANIGFFSLFASRHRKDLTIYAFEPIPATFQALQTNMELHAVPVDLFPIGIGDRPGEASFTFYPQMPGLSGRYSEPQQDRSLSRAIMLAGLDRKGSETGSALARAEVEELLDEQFRSETHRCPIRTLSEIIDERGIEVIDLLKVDVERAELDVLLGLRQEHWPRIRQISMEVDGRERLEAIVDLLGHHEYAVSVDDFMHVHVDGGGEPVEVYMLYARRSGVRRAGTRRSAVSRAAAQRLSTAELRAYLRESLPEHMLPALFVPLDALPVTPNGKLDRRALPDPEGRLGPQAGYVAPHTPVEKLLAGIWERVLGIERVGLHDSFFELGGDSILSIRLIALAQQAGLRLTPRQLFQHQTVAELAAVATVAAAPTTGQGEVTGPVKLTPIQHWFFEQDLPNPHHWNHAVLVKTRADLPPVHLATAFDRLVEHHDALRLRFHRGAEGWRQENAPAEGTAPFTRVDLSGLPVAERRRAQDFALAMAQTSLDLSRGPVLRAVLVEHRGGEPGRLLLTVHHLIVDGISWRVLIEDLQTACSQLATGAPVAFPAKTVSFQRWTAHLAAQADAPATRAEIPFWLSPERAGALPSLPVDDPTAPNTEGSAGTLAVWLEVAETAELLQKVPEAYRTRVDDVLLAALVQGFAAWTGRDSLLVAIEGHGREEVGEYLDVSRTTGWFATFAPVLLDLGGATEPGEALKTVKEQVRALPRRGIGYGLLRYLGTDRETAGRLRALPQPEVSFNYLGQLQAFTGDALFRPAGEPAGAARDPRQPRRYLLDVSGDVSNGRLRLLWTYPAGRLAQSTVQRLADACRTALQALIRHCTEPGAGGYTPADFPLVALDQPALDRLVGARAEEIDDLLPLSPLQQGLLFHSLETPEAAIYLLQLCCTLTGDLDPEAFAAAWQSVVDRHPVLRASFFWEGLEEPVQQVWRQARLPIVWEDWRHLPEAERRERLARLEEEDRHRPFDLSVSPLIRMTLVRCGEREHRLVWSYHHLLLDAWSAAMVVDEVFALYTAHRNGTSPSLTAPRPYAEYLAWLRRQDLREAEEFWRRSLAGFTAPTLPGAVRPAGLAVPAEREQAQARITLPPGAIDELRALARRRRLTLNTVLLGAWAFLLGSSSSADDVVTGVTSSGREVDLPGVESMVGVFINTLPLRLHLDPQVSLGAWLEQVQTRLVEMRRFEHTPLVQVQQWSDIGKGLPLFESIFVVENHAAGSSPQRADLQAHDFRTLASTSYPLSLLASPAGDLGLEVIYDRGRIDAAAAERLLGHLGSLLARWPGQVEEALGRLSFLTMAERAELLATPAPTPHADDALCLHQLFARQVLRSPGAAAVRCGGRELTYAELQQEASRLARHLLELGAAPDRPVALVLERSVDLVVAIIAVLEAGAAYLPIDPLQPAERIAFLLADAGASLAVTHRGLAAHLPASGLTIVDLDADRGLIGNREGSAPALPADPGHLAYVIYTSGSTGTPKGTLITHRNVVRLFTGSHGLFDFNARDVWTLFHSYAFDFSVWEIWGALLHGGRLVVVPRETSRSPEDFHRLLAAEGVTVLSQTPSAFRRLAEVDAEAPAPLALRWVIFGGEALAPDALAGWMARHGEERPRLVNMYGITETTVHVTFRALTAADATGTGRSPIGGPLPDLRLALLNPWLQPMPAGAAGELFVGGPGLALGYLGRPSLTAERFIPDPFSTLPGERLYRTGDLALRLPGGGFEYLGRTDHQVKIRGFRIEPGEIEAVLRRHAAVRDALVLALDGTDGDRRLVAYVAVGSAAPAVDELRDGVRQHLPEHMVPAAFVLLDTFPLTINGKIDRRSLPAPDRERPEVGGGYLAPRDPVEELLAGIWADVLGLERVGVRDDFLALGGHSLLATRLVARIRQRLEVDLPLHELFENPTVESLAEAVERRLRPEGRRLVPPPLVRRPREGGLPLSFAQQRLWFLDRWLPGSPLFNVPFALELAGRLDVAALAAAFAEVVRRHEVLRTRYPEHRGVPAQVIEEPESPRIPRIDLGGLAADRSAAEAEMIAAEEARQPFDLRNGPVLRVMLVRLREEEHRLLATLHHIACDGWSIGVLVREIAELYRARREGRVPELPELPVQYADFAAWQRDRLQGEALEEQLSYWRRRLAGAPTAPALPTDRPRPAVQTHRGGLVPIALPAAQTAALEALGRRHGATLFMTAVALFQVLLRHVTGRNDILVGSDVTNRDRIETEGLIGFFVNQLALRTDLAGNLTLPELLRRVRTAALGAYAHREVPFERLIEALQIERSLAHTPLFQVKIFFVDPQEELFRLQDLTVRRLGSDSGTAKLDLTLALQVTPQGLRGSLEYNRDLFETSTAERWAHQLQTLLATAAERPVSRIEELEHTLQEIERKQKAMEKTERRPAGFDPFKSIKPKAVSLGHGAVVKKGHLAPGQLLPLVIEPAIAEADPIEWATAHRQEIDQDLLRYGAILFRGFALGAPEAFEQLAAAVCSDLFNENGEHPRESVSGNVYTPVYYPPDQKLLWHNENSFNLSWPMKILFGCARPADEGGETPIVDSRRVFEAIDPDIRRRFVEKQVLYQRNFGVGVGLDWRTVFQTDDREDLERRAAAERIELSWKSEDRLTTRSLRPAAARHPVTGEWTWFNQAQHWHVSCLDPETRRSMESIFAPDDLPRNCFYGDGAPITDEEMAHVLSVYQRFEVSFPWRQGDVMLLDNMLVAHARNPFRGERRLLVALGEMKAYDEIQTGGPHVD